MIGTVIVASIYDALIENNKNSLIISFSLKKNFKYLLDFEWKLDDIKVIHGIRCVNAVLIIIGHKSMYLYFEPYINRTHMNEVRKIYIVQDQL